MQTREGFGQHGNVSLFDDFPTTTTVAETLTARRGPSPGVIKAVLEEFAFCMKTATRLGRVVRIGDRWWGHPQTYGSRQMAVVDEYERTGVTADEFDLWAVLDPSDLIALVSARTGIVPAVVDSVISEFCAQVESFRVQGIHFCTPPRQLGSAAFILDQLATNLDVLASHDHDIVSAERALSTDETDCAHLLCRDSAGALLVIELHPGPETSTSTSPISAVLDSLDEPEPRGLVLSDGYSQRFVEDVMTDDRVIHRNLRSLDLPVCRAQRWSIHDVKTAEITGWLAVAADGRTVVNGGGESFPTLAFFEPFEQLPLDWERFRLQPGVVR